MAPNPHQQEKLEQLRREIGRTEPLPIICETDGYVFTEVDGVSVIVTKRRNPRIRGGFKIPSVRKYEEGLDAALLARSLWEAQRDRDSADPARTAEFVLGHFGPIVDCNWMCRNRSCTCQTESLERRKDRSLRG